MSSRLIGFLFFGGIGSILILGYFSEGISYGSPVKRTTTSRLSGETYTSYGTYGIFDVMGDLFILAIGIMMIVFAIKFLTQVD